MMSATVCTVLARSRGSSIGGEAVGHPQSLLDLAQDHHAAIGQQMAAVKTGDNFFALDR